MSRSTIVTIALIITVSATLPVEPAHAQESGSGGPTSSATAPLVPLIAYRSSSALDISMDGRIEESV